MSVSSNSSSFRFFQFSFPHSLAWLHLNLSSVALRFPEFLPLFLFPPIPCFFFFFLTLLVLFISQLHHCDDFLNIPLHSLFFSCCCFSFLFSFSFHFRSSNLFFSYSSVLFCLFSSHSSSFLLFQFNPVFRICLI